MGFGETIYIRLQGVGDVQTGTLGKFSGRATEGEIDLCVLQCWGAQVGDGGTQGGHRFACNLLGGLQFAGHSVQDHVHEAVGLLQA